MDLLAAVTKALGESFGSVTPLTGGASYRSYRITTAAGVHRHVRTTAGAEQDDETTLRVGLFVEAELLRRAHDAGVPVPQVVGFSQDPEVLVSEWLEGETLGGRIARRPAFEAARGKFARQCGQALGRIHSVPVDGLNLDHQTAESFIRRTHERYRGLGVVRPMLDGVARALLNTAPEPAKVSLVHGDFRNGNLMVHPDDGIVGVLDWELARIGDPMQDLGYLMLNSWRFGVPEREVGGCGSAAELFAAYEAEAGVAVDQERVRWWQAAGSFWWGVTCLVQAARFDPERPSTMEFAAIGPRVSEAEVDCANLLLPGVTVTLDSIHESEGRWSPALTEAVRLGTTEFGSGYRSRVIGSMIDTLQRESRLGWSVQNQELGRLIELFGTGGFLDDLRRRLADSLWEGRRSIADPTIADHLIRTALNDLRIDQPSYSAPPLTDLIER